MLSQGTQEGNRGRMLVRKSDRRAIAQPARREIRLGWISVPDVGAPLIMRNVQPWGRPAMSVTEETTSLLFAV